jgi:carbon storage regulator CsrA
MLILTRRLGETINVGDQQSVKLEIRVLGYEKGEVKLGLSAPKDMLLLRGEIDNRPRRFNAKDE